MRRMTGKRAGTEAGPYGMTEPWRVVGRGASRSVRTGTHSGEGRIVMRPYAHTDKLGFVGVMS